MKKNSAEGRTGSADVRTHNGKQVVRKGLPGEVTCERDQRDEGVSTQPEQRPSGGSAPGTARARAGVAGLKRARNEQQKWTANRRGFRSLAACRTGF